MAVAAAGTIATAAEAQEIETEQDFEHGHWTGLAHTYDGGKLVYCSLAASYRNGILLGINLSGDGSLSIDLMNESWDLGTEEKYRISLAIDSRGHRSLEAIGDRGGLTIPLGIDDRLYEALRQGRRLTVVGAKETFNFSLTGSSVGLRKLRDCVRRHTVMAQGRDDSGRAPGQDASAAPLPPPAESTPQGAPRAVPETAPQSASKEGASKPGASKEGGFPFDAAGLKSMLVASGVPAPTVFPVQEAKLGDFSFFSRAWNVPEDPSISGQVLYFPFLLGDPEVFLSVLIDSQTRGCQGEETSTIDSASVAAGATVGRATVICDGPDQRTVIYMSGLFTAKETLIFLSSGSGAGMETARAVDEGMRGRMPNQ